MDTDKLTELITREVIRILEQRKNEKDLITVKFCGEDNLLKDELSKKVSLSENGDILVISSLCINDMIDIAIGKKLPAIEYILEKKTVYIVEEGLEYKKYSVPKSLIATYDGYVNTITKYGIQVISRLELLTRLKSAEKVEMKGVITSSKLQGSNIKNTKLILEKSSLITPLAKEYIKENNIELLYERG